MLLSIVAILIVLFLVFDWKKRRYWKERGVNEPPGSLPFFGHFLSVLTLRTPLGLFYWKFYEQQKNTKYFGTFEFQRPVLVISDPKLAETVLTKEFSSFADHVDWMFTPNSCLRNSPFAMRGNYWRALRYRTSSGFSVIKMSKAFERLHDVSLVPHGVSEIELLDVSRRYCIDGILSFWGARISQGRNEFAAMVKEQTDLKSLKRWGNVIMLEHFRNAAMMLGIKVMPSKIDREYEELVDEISRSEYRSEFKDILEIIQHEKKVVLRGKDFNAEGSSSLDFIFEPTDDELRGFISQFLFAGFDTTSGTLAVLGYHLAENKRVQEKLRKHIKEIFDKHGNKWTYEALQDLTYLQLCIYESSRLFPVFPFLFREVTKDFQFEDGLRLVKGQKIILPSLGFHLDSEYYPPDPMEFRPERWEALKDPKSNVLWLPFGTGSRQCVGMRFSFMEMKLFFAELLMKFDMTLNPKTKPLEPEAKVFIGRPKHPIYVNLTELN